MRCGWILAAAAWENKTRDLIVFVWLFFLAVSIFMQRFGTRERRGRVKGHDPGGEDPGGGRGISLKHDSTLKNEKSCVCHCYWGVEIFNFKLNFQD